MNLYKFNNTGFSHKLKFIYQHICILLSHLKILSHFHKLVRRMITFYEDLENQSNFSSIVLLSIKVVTNVIASAPSHSNDRKNQSFQPQNSTREPTNEHCSIGS